MTLRRREQGAWFAALSLSLVIAGCGGTHLGRGVGGRTGSTGGSGGQGGAKDSGGDVGVPPPRDSASTDGSTSDGSTSPGDAAADAQGGAGGSVIDARADTGAAGAGGTNDASSVDAKDAAPDLGAEGHNDGGDHPGDAGGNGPDASSPPDGGSGLASCPASAPIGACALDQQVCPYADRACVCDHGTWDCTPCPAQRPTIGDDCPAAADSANGNPSFACKYGAATCTCDISLTFQNQWGCGVCPASEPASGASCGNGVFSCSYGVDDCLCLGSTWNCTARSCPKLSDQTFSTYCQAAYTCQYPELGTNCTCSGNFWSCACPSSAPIEGAACVALASNQCAYSDQTCTCMRGSFADTQGTWHCLASCPTAGPADGSACHSTLSCTYDGGLCYCDGTTWHCS